DRGQIALAEAPLFAHQAADLGPVGPLELAAEFLCHLGDPGEIAKDLFVSVDVVPENIPVIDCRFAGLAGVTEHQATLEFGQGDAEFGAALAAWRQFDRGRSAKRGRVVVLRSGGYVNHDGFGVSADVNPVGLALAGTGVAVEGGTNRNCHGAGAADAG